MDLKSLNTFIQTAELNSFTKAAEKLGYSQPTVSLQIRQLEQELGIQLFERIGHTVTLTRDGRAALSYAQKICHMSREMILDVQGKNDPHGILRIAMADSLCSPLLIRKFSAFNRMYPHITVQVIPAGTGEMFRLLDHNEVDLACTLDSHIYNHTYVISHEEQVHSHFICAADHPFADRKTVSLYELLSEPFILTEKGMSYRRLLDEYLAQHFAEIQPILEIGRTDLICQLVAENTGLSLLPDFITEEYVQAGQLCRFDLEGFQPELWKQILYHRDKWMALPLETAIQYLSQITLSQTE